MTKEIYNIIVEVLREAQNLYTKEYIRPEPNKCYFCGRDVEVKVESEKCGFGEYREEAYMKCPNCYAEGPHILEGEASDLIDAAITLWNNVYQGR